MEQCTRCGRISSNPTELTDEYNAKLCDYCFSTLVNRLEHNRITYNKKRIIKDRKITKKFLKECNDTSALGAVTVLIILLIALIIYIAKYT